MGLLHHHYTTFFIYHHKAIRKISKNQQSVSEKLCKESLFPDKRCNAILESEMLEEETGTRECLAT